MCVAGLTSSGADCEGRAVAEVEDVVERVLLRPKRHDVAGRVRRRPKRDVAGRVLLGPKRDVAGRLLLRPKRDVAGRVLLRPKRVGPGKLLRPIESKESGAGRVAG